MKRIFLIILFTAFTLQYGYSNDSAKTSNLNGFPEKIEIHTVNEQKSKDWNKIVIDWIITITAVISAASLTIGIWKSLKEYRLKIEAEKRVAESQKVETDIKLIAHFAQLMETAHGISGNTVSDKVIEMMFEKDLLKDDYNNLPEMKSKMNELSVFRLPVGIAAQDSAIAALAVLAKRHPILLLPTIQAFESMLSFKKDVVEKYLPELKRQI